MNQLRLSRTSIYSSALLLLSFRIDYAQTTSTVPTISSIAGNGTVGFSGDNGPATQAEINNPSGITTDASGNVYFSDSNNYRVRKVTTSSGIISTVVGTGMPPANIMTALPPAPALMFPLYNPTAVAVAKDGTTYVLDLGTAMVSPAGLLTEDYANPANDLAIDGSGNVYAIDINSAAVYKYTQGAAPQVVAGTLNPTGNTSSGDGGPALKATFNAITAIAVDASGNIYVADSGDLTVRKFQPGGNITTVAGMLEATPPPTTGPAIGDGGPATQAPLQFSNGNGVIAVDNSGNLYIAELTNRVRKISSNGIIQTYAGNGSSGRYLGDGGPALQATINPQNLAVDAAGDLYIVHITNGEQRILKISPASTTTGGGNAPKIAAVISAAANLPSVTPGGFVSIYGSNLSSTTRGWAAADFINNALPDSLDGVSVTIDGQPAAVSFVSPGQLNIVAPDDSNVGTVNVIVTNAMGSSASFPIALTAATPAFFTLDGKHIIAQHLNYSLVTTAGSSGTPAMAGETIIIYGTGFGATNPPTPSNMLVSAVAPLAINPTVTVGGVNAPVSFAGIIASGLYQLNVTMPQVTSGDQTIVATVGTVTSQTGAVVPIQ